MKYSYVILFAAVFAFAGCKKKQTVLPTVTPECAVITVETQSVELNRNYPATLKGKQDVEIRPRVQGFITQLSVDEGAVVRKGQTLFKLNDTEFQSAVSAAQAAVKVAQANIATQKITVENKRGLAEKGIISDYDLQIAENQLASLEAGLEQAQTSLVTAKQNLSYTIVTSPSDGVVGTIPYRTGSLVSSAITPALTTVSDISQVYAYFSLTEKELLERTKSGTSFPAVALQLIDGSAYNEQGKVETVSGVIDQATGSVTLRALFPNPNKLLRSGATAQVLIPYQNDAAIVVPQKAIVEIQDKHFAFLVGDGNTAKQIEVSVLDLNDGLNYIITAGLAVGDKLIIENASTLKEGTVIKPVTPAQSQKNFKEGLTKQVEMPK